MGVRCRRPKLAQRARALAAPLDLPERIELHQVQHLTWPTPYRPQRVAPKFGSVYKRNHAYDFDEISFSSSRTRYQVTRVFQPGPHMARRDGAFGGGSRIGEGDVREGRCALSGPGTRRTSSWPTSSWSRAGVVHARANAAVLSRRDDPMLTAPLHRLEAPLRRRLAHAVAIREDVDAVVGRGPRACARMAAWCRQAVRAPREHGDGLPSGPGMRRSSTAHETS
jgi:hypothetical protein